MRIRNLSCVFLKALSAGTVLFSTSVYADDLFDLPLEQLLETKITSVSKHEEKVSNAAAAIYVLTSVDIKRSGAKTIPDALRMVPGMNIGQAAGAQYTVSSRGFQRIFTDKLLVLVDGRAVYTPLFGGVFWDEVDVVMEDIERIEVIRGPGATLWGANAVNGVINVITKSAKDTVGGLAVGGGGTHEQLFGTLRYGDSIADSDYRVYAKYFNRENNRLNSGGPANDDWQGVSTGGRLESQLTKKDRLSLQADVRHTEFGVNFLGHSAEESSIEVASTRMSTGFSLLSKWEHEFSPRSEASMQMYYDYINREDVLLAGRRDLVDFELQHHYVLNDMHQFLWGAGYRFYADNNDSSGFISVLPAHRNVDLSNGFFQDEITLSPDTFRLILGAKLEHNDFSGIEFQPNARVVWTPNTSFTWWGAVSKATRSPARFNHDGHLNVAVVPTELGLPGVVTLDGDGNYNGTHLIAYETGVRSKLSSELFMDLALFYNRYTDLDTAEPGVPELVAGDVPYIRIPYALQSKMHGESMGGELSLTYTPTAWWRLIPSYSFWQLELTQDADSLDSSYVKEDKESPRNQAMLRSLLDLPGGFEFDTFLRYVDALPTFNVDSYIDLDLRLGWHYTKDVEFSIVGQNLLRDSHLEAIANQVEVVPTDVSRGVYGQLRVKF